MFLNNPIIDDDLNSLLKSNKESVAAFKNKHFLVTGATGMIPSYLVYFLLFLSEIAGCSLKISALVRNKKKAERLFGHYLRKNNVNLIVGDVCDEHTIGKKLDYIIHGASPASPQYFHSDPVGTLLPNVLGTYNLLEEGKKHSLDCFLFLSSSSIYGSLSKSSVITESIGGWVDPMAVSSAYSEGKRMGESMCIAWHRQFSLPTRIVRIGHAYGPTMDYEQDERAFSYFVRCVIKGEDIVLKSDGASVLEFLYLRDVINGFIKVLINGKDGEVYNLSNAKEQISILNLAEMVASLSCDKKINIHVKRGNQNSVGSSRRTDVSKLVKLGWNPEIMVQEGFEKTINSIKYYQKA